MIKISKQNNSLIVEGIENAFYINNGDNSYPLNSLIVVTDNSDMATFRSVATNDVLFSGLIKDITINGEAVTKDNIIQKFDAVSNEGTVDAYTKEEADTKFASKTELTNVQTVANDADTKVDALTPRVESVETAMNDKQDLLVSGTNIKTINNQSILGEGNLEISGDVDLTNYYTKPEADGKFATITGFNEQAADISALQTAMDGKQATLVSGENIKTINSESILGNGDIQINAGAKIVKIGDSPFSNFYDLLSNAVSALNNGTDYTKTWLSLDETIGEQFLDLFKTLKNGDILSKYDKFFGDMFKVECNPFYFNPNADGYSYDILIKYLGNFNSHNFINYTRDIYLYLYFSTSRNSGKIGEVELKVYTKKAGPTLQKNDFKTINGESLIGEGNIEVSGVSEEQAQEIAKIPTLETELAQKANVSDVPTVQTDYDGTNKNYIYSSYSDKKCSVYSDFIFRPYANSMDMACHLWGKDQSWVQNFKVPLVTTSKAGVMSAADKTKLDSIPENIPTQTEVDNIAANVSTLETAMNGKQDTLVSGTNIKTINGNSILGEGNLEITGGDVDLTNYYTKTETDTKLDTKQNTLVSGTNIKTINSQSILGEGNIEVTMPDATTATSGAMSAADKTKLDSISNEWSGTQQEYDALTTKDNNTIYYVTE